MSISTMNSGVIERCPRSAASGMNQATPLMRGQRGGPLPRQLCLHQKHPSRAICVGPQLSRRKRSLLIEAAVGTVSSKSKVFYGLAAERGLRDDMEDYASVLQGNVDRGDFVYAGVFDGHAGRMAAEYLNKNLGACLQKKLKEAGDVSQALVTKFEGFDEELMDYLQANAGEEWNCGSTATVSLMYKDKIVVANVGDSRAVLSRRGRAVDLSSEHRPYGKSPISVREMDRIKASGGWITDGRVMGILAVSRAFGDMEFKRGLDKLLVDGVLEKMWTKSFAKSVQFTAPPVVVTPDVMEVKIEDGDEFLVVASDGLWEVMTSSQAVSFVTRHLRKVGVCDEGLQSAADALVADAVTRRKTSDNVSCVVMSLPTLTAGSSSPAPTKSASVGGVNTLEMQASDDNKIVAMFAQLFATILSLFRRD